MTEKFLNSLGDSTKKYGLLALLASLTAGGVNSYLESEISPINETPSQRRKRLLKAFLKPAGITAGIAGTLGLGKAVYDLNLSDSANLSPTERKRALVLEKMNKGWKLVNGHLVPPEKVEDYKTITDKGLESLGNSIRSITDVSNPEQTIWGLSSAATSSLLTDRIIQSKFINNSDTASKLKHYTFESSNNNNSELKRKRFRKAEALSGRKLGKLKAIKYLVDLLPTLPSFYVGTSIPSIYSKDNVHGEHTNTDSLTNNTLDNVEIVSEK